jgi:membrane protease YdiL (CAAX protease family)
VLLAIAFIVARRRGFRLSAPFAPRPSPPAAWQKVLLGLAAGAALLPLATIPRWYHYNVASIGEVPPIWDVIYASEWTPSFWVFMAIASFALIPLVEELFFRGYVLGSLAKRFSPNAAVLLSALIFMAVHVRYAQWDAFALFNWTSIFLFAAAAALIVYRTSSLLPAISMHVYVNLPRPLSWSLYELALVIPVLFILFAMMRTDNIRAASPS